MPSPSAPTATDPGFQVAPGDPGQISQAAAYHQELADALELHYATIRGAAGQVVGLWDGEAASAYQQLSSEVAAHFHSAAGGARTAAAALRRYSQELDHCQQDGTRALHNAEWWLAQQSMWRTRYNRACQAVTDAQNQLISAEGQSAHTGTNGGVADARAALEAATGAQRTAREHLDECIGQVLKWQAKGRAAWEQAIEAAGRATGSMEAIHVAPPPLAGWARPDEWSRAAAEWARGQSLGEEILHGVGAVGLFLAGQAGRAIAASLPGHLLQLYSDASGRTVGVCAGGEATFGGGGAGQLCYDATPSGQSGFTVSAGPQAGSPGAGVSVGVQASNAQNLGQLGRGFDDVGGNAGVGGTVGGSYSWGRSDGHTIGVGETNVGVGVGPPAGVHGGWTYTWTDPTSSGPAGTP